MGSGKVVVKVNINQAGVVTEASYVPKGSTTSDKALVDAALKAARQARFTQSKEFYYTGHITYVFIIK
jgi:TonB family protein